MPSAKRPTLTRLGLLLVCALLLTGLASGCTTTQEKAAAEQARAKQILWARAERAKEQAKRKKSRSQKR